MKLESLPTLLRSGNVLRCHTLTCLNRPTVGLHTYRTLVILHWLYFPKHPPANVNYAMLVHDMPEISTGDMPGNIKADNVAVAGAFEMLEYAFHNMHNLNLGIHEQLTEQEAVIIGFCDRADLTLYALSEIELGNRSLQMLAMACKACQMTSDKHSYLLKSNGINGQIDTDRLSFLMRELFNGVRECT